MANTLYTLEVFIIEGPVTEEFARANPVMSRTIEIQCQQTLEQLHAAIFAAFDREEEHPYEFHLGEDPDDLEGVRYGLPSSGETPLLMSVAVEQDFGLSIADDPVGDVTTTTITDLGLTVGRLFGYWFDFGDGWYHKINVVTIGEAGSTVKYPRVTARVGGSPPQYVGENGCEAPPPGPPDDLQGEQRPRSPGQKRRETGSQLTMEFHDE